MTDPLHPLTETVAETLFRLGVRGPDDDDKGFTERIAAALLASSLIQQVAAQAWGEGENAGYWADSSTQGDREDNPYTVEGSDPLAGLKADASVLIYDDYKQMEVGTVIADRQKYWEATGRHWVKTTDNTWAVFFHAPSDAEVAESVSERRNNVSPCPSGPVQIVRSRTNPLDVSKPIAGSAVHVRVIQQGPNVEFIEAEDETGASIAPDFSYQEGDNTVHVFARTFSAELKAEWQAEARFVIDGNPLTANHEPIPTPIGPFPSRDAAREWARVHIANGSHHLAPLTNPAAELRASSTRGEVAGTVAP